MVALFPTRACRPEDHWGTGSRECPGQVGARFKLAIFAQPVAFAVFIVFWPCQTAKKAAYALIGGSVDLRSISAQIDEQGEREVALLPATRPLVRNCICGPLAALVRSGS